MRRARPDDLPPCLTLNRDWLDPARTVGMVRTSPPGSNCAPGCPFELCPYPPKGEQTRRVELSEAFCRRQQYLLAGRRRVGPAWWQQDTPRDNLKGFWARMGRRAER